MGIFYIKKNQQAVQGFQPNRSYTKAEADAKFGNGGGLVKLTATGTVDGSNVTFTFTQKPTYIVSDGAWYVENSGWTWSGLTATLSVPPQTGIFGFA